MSDQHESGVNASGDHGEICEADLDIKQRLNMQTAKIGWSELQRFFAAGKAVCVDSSLDLIDVAAAMHADDAQRIQDLMVKQLFALVSDAQAKTWTQESQELWAVVVSPWVLVQVPKGALVNS